MLSILTTLISILMSIFLGYKLAVTLGQEKNFGFVFGVSFSLGLIWLTFFALTLRTGFRLPFQRYALNNLDADSLIRLWPRMLVNLPILIGFASLAGWGIEKIQDWDR